MIFLVNEISHLFYVNIAEKHSPQFTIIFNELNCLEKKQKLQFDCCLMNITESIFFKLKTATKRLQTVLHLHKEGSYCTKAIKDNKILFDKLIAVVFVHEIKHLISLILLQKNVAKLEFFYFLPDSNASPASELFEFIVPLNCEVYCYLNLTISIEILFRQCSIIFVLFFPHWTPNINFF